MTRVIAIASGKGGVGKTTVAANLGIALSLLEEDVLIMDMDIKMANLELIVGLEGKKATLQDVLSGKDNIYNAVYEGPGGVQIVPAGLSLPNLKKVKRSRMEQVFEDLIGNVDIIIIDSPAGLERDALAAMSPADEMILVTTPEVTSITDTLKTKLIAERMDIDILGVVVNRNQYYEEFLTPDEIESILEVPIITIIPEDDELISFFAYGTPFTVEEPESPTSNIFMELAAYLVDKEYYQPDVPKESFISKFIDGILGNIPFKAKKIKGY
ncbi:MAG: cell division ATPase MinD [Methanobacterium sp.]|nr:cell division ATPase MinD [Methanobacterium sp.]